MTQERLEQANSILWIEDEKDMETLVKQRLRQEIKDGTYDFTFASTFTEAQDILSKLSTPPLVLCDINLPDGSGIDILDGLSRRFGKLAVVIMVTAYGEMNMIRKAMHSGTFDFITKPIDFADLQLTLKRAFEYRQLQLSLRDELRGKLRLEQEMHFARSIQLGLIGDESKLSKLGSFVDVHAEFLPAHELGGSLYDYRVLEDGRHLIFMANVSGSGMSGALYMAKTHSILHSLIKSTKVDNASRLVSLMNDILCDHNATGHFVTCFCGILAPSKGALSYICAGHIPPLTLKDGDKVLSLDATGDLALGVKSNLKLSEKTAWLLPGQVLVLYNHGATEIRGKNGEPLANIGFQSLVGKMVQGKGKQSSRDLCLHIVSELKESSQQSRLNEDVALMVISYLNETNG